VAAIVTAGTNNIATTTSGVLVESEDPLIALLQHVWLQDRTWLNHPDKALPCDTELGVEEVDLLQRMTTAATAAAAAAFNKHWVGDIEGRVTRELISDEMG
jgi:hypothetical protein